MTKPAYRGAWRRVRKQILERDGYVCQVRGPRCQVTATEVDHIVPVSQGGQWLDPFNLRASCKRCNVGRRNHRFVDHASVSDVVARLRTLGLDDAATQAEEATRPKHTPSRDW